MGERKPEVNVPRRTPAVGELKPEVNVPRRTPAVGELELAKRPGWLPTVVMSPVGMLSPERICSKEVKARRDDSPSNSFAWRAPLALASISRTSLRALLSKGGGRPFGAVQCSAPFKNFWSSPPPSLELPGVAISFFSLLERNVVNFLGTFTPQGANDADDMFGAGGGRTRLRSDPTRHPLLAASKNSAKALFLSAGS